MDLFAAQPRDIPLAEGAVLLGGFALPDEAALLAAVEAVAAVAPFRHMETPNGFRMSAAMTNCGAAGWVTDRRGYRYDPLDPESGRPWPTMPSVFADLARRAASAAGYPDFAPDSALINFYEPGARMSAHQDMNEGDASAPIVSLSLGLPMTFLFGGLQRTDPMQRVPLAHGDVVVWGGPSRRAFHGVNPLKEGVHPLLGRRRINVTFRKAL
ncbi:MAG TPA: DNA oxidative demethylase AlkB [Alphaproteobacteria bacterium]